MTHFEDFAHLLHLQAEDVFGDETHVLLSADLDLLLEFEVLFGHVLDTGEEIFNQLDEDVLIVGDDLGDVEVSETLHQKFVFGGGGVATLQLTSLSKHGLDGTKSPIVVLGLRQQVSGQGVEGHEFLRERLGELETFGHQHVFANEFQVRHHHSATTELSLQVFGEFGSSGVTGVHGNEETYGVFNVQFTFFHEREDRLVFLQGVQDALDLGGDHGEHFDRNTVEFIEATPGTCLG